MIDTRTRTLQGRRISRGLDNSIAAGGVGRDTTGDEDDGTATLRAVGRAAV